MEKTVNIENELSQKQRQRDELAQRYKEALRTEVQYLTRVMHGAQISIHVIEGKNLRLDPKNALKRKIRLVCEKNIIETKEFNSAGVVPSAKWDESFLLPLTARDKPVKVIFVQKERSRDRVLGSTLLNLEKYANQKRHDAWFDLGGCGQVRLAIRFVHSRVLFYQDFVSQTDKEIRQLKYNLKNPYVDTEENADADSDVAIATNLEDSWTQTTPREDTSLPFIIISPIKDDETPPDDFLDEIPQIIEPPVMEEETPIEIIQEQEEVIIIEPPVQEEEAPVEKEEETPVEEEWIIEETYIGPSEEEIESLRRHHAAKKIQRAQRRHATWCTARDAAKRFTFNSFQIAKDAFAARQTLPPFEPTHKRTLTVETENLTSEEEKQDETSQEPKEIEEEHSDTAKSFGSNEGLTDRLRNIIKSVSPTVAESITPTRRANLFVPVVQQTIAKPIEPRHSTIDLSSAPKKASPPRMISGGLKDMIKQLRQKDEPASGNEQLAMFVSNTQEVSPRIGENDARKSMLPVAPAEIPQVEAVNPLLKSASTISSVGTLPASIDQQSSPPIATRIPQPPLPSTVETISSVESSPNVNTRIASQIPKPRMPLRQETLLSSDEESAWSEESETVDQQTASKVDNQPSVHSSEESDASEESITVEQPTPAKIEEVKPMAQPSLHMSTPSLSVVEPADVEPAVEIEKKSVPLVLLNQPKVEEATVAVEQKSFPLPLLKPPTPEVAKLPVQEEAKQPIKEEVKPPPKIEVKQQPAKVALPPAQDSDEDSEQEDDSDEEESSSDDEFTQIRYGKIRR